MKTTNGTVIILLNFIAFVICVGMVITFFQNIKPYNAYNDIQVGLQNGGLTYENF